MTVMTGMTSKLGSILTKIGNGISIAALAIVVIAPIMWLDSPYLSVWPLAHALCILWDVTPKTHKLWDLWLSAAFRVAVTVWEIVDVTFFSEGIHPSVWAWLCGVLGVRPMRSRKKQNDTKNRRFPHGSACFRMYGGYSSFCMIKYFPSPTNSP